MNTGVNTRPTIAATQFCTSCCQRKYYITQYEIDLSVLGFYEHFTYKFSIDINKSLLNPFKRSAAKWLQFTVFRDILV